MNHKKAGLSLTLFFVFCTLFSFAQSAVTPADAEKGKRGGLIIGQGSLRYEMLDNGSSVSFYPVSTSGTVLSAMPLSADITIVYQDTRQQNSFKGVVLQNGCFTVSPDREMPIYIYAISSELNEQTYAAKYRVSDLKAR